jgi:hypothetical protein
MDPFSIFIATIVAGAILDRSDQAEEKRRAILGDSKKWPDMTEPEVARDPELKRRKR